MVLRKYGYNIIYVFILDLERCHCERFTWIYACTYSFLFFANLTLFHNKITSNQIRKVKIVKHKSLMVDGKLLTAGTTIGMYIAECMCLYVCINTSRVYSHIWRMDATCGEMKSKLELDVNTEVIQTETDFQFPFAINGLCKST